MNKKITAIAATGALALGIVVGASANGIIEKVQAELRGDFVIKTNGQVQTLKNANGEVVYPLLYQGTTYLPVRAISELNNKEVVWYEDTKTVDIVDKQGNTVIDADKVVAGEKDNPQTPTPEPAPSQNIPDAVADAKVTLDKAVEIAAAKAGITAAELYTKNADYDYENGKYVIDVEIDTKDTEYDAKIDAVSGEIIEWKSNTDRKNANINLTGAISLDRAIEIVIAEKNIPAGQILAKKASYDYERGKTVVDVEIYVDGAEYDVVLDAVSGMIIG